MSEKRRWKDHRGSASSAYFYSPDELTEAWHKDGQGHDRAVARGQYCVVIACDRANAIVLHALFLRQFNIPTCVTYDGKTLSLYCGDAGSGAPELLRDIWRMVASFMSGDFHIDENGPLFAQTND